MTVSVTGPGHLEEAEEMETETGVAAMENASDTVTLGQLLSLFQVPVTDTVTLGQRPLKGQYNLQRNGQQHRRKHRG